MGKGLVALYGTADPPSQLSAQEGEGFRRYHAGINRAKLSQRATHHAEAAALRVTFSANRGVRTTYRLCSAWPIFS